MGVFEVNLQDTPTVLGPVLRVTGLSSGPQGEGGF